MLIADISDQLGNQMFAYASVKTIAEKKGYSFGFVRAHNDRINDSDQQYGNEIHTIFPQVQNDFLQQIPSDIKYTFIEKRPKGSNTIYLNSALLVQDQTYMKGHFLSYQYFSDNLEHVQQWFTFSQDVMHRCNQKINFLYQKYPDKELVAIHFRVGQDYLRQGFLLASSYWFRAADKMVQKYGKDHVLFVPFFDTQTGSGKVVQQFIKKYPCEIIHGSLVEDMCCMTLFKNMIVCNSTFSIMSGILNQTPSKIVFRPSVYPAESRYIPTDCFPDTWTVIPARRSRASLCNYYWMCLKGQLLKLLKKVKCSLFQILFEIPNTLP